MNGASSAKQNKRFLLLFLEKEVYRLAESIAGGMPPDPQGRLRRAMGLKGPSAKQNKRFLLLFLEKEEYGLTESFAGGTPPDPQGRLRRAMGLKGPSAKQNKRFLLLFLEKEEYHSTNSLQTQGQNIGLPKLGEADTGGSGGLAPQKTP
jgi:hypothetical protein